MYSVHFTLRGIRSFLFCFPVFDKICLLPQFYIGTVPGELDFSLRHSGHYGAPRFGPVRAVIKTALSQIGFKFFKAELELRRTNALHLIYLEGAEARRIGYVSAKGQGKQFHMSGGVSPPAEALADLACFQSQSGVKRVEQACFSHAGVPRKGAHAPCETLFDFLCSFPGLCAGTYATISIIFFLV